MDTEFMVAEQWGKDCFLNKWFCIHLWGKKQTNPDSQTPRHATHKLNPR